MRLVLLLALASCGWRHAASHGAATVQIADGTVRGGEVVVAQQWDGIGVRLDADGQVLERTRTDASVPPTVVHQERFGGGFGLGMSFSPLGFVAANDRLTRWFDVGVAGSVGGGLVYPDRLSTYGQAWAGAWMVIGLAPWDVHPALIFEARGVTVSEWDDAAVFCVSLALVKRHGPRAPFRM